MAHLGSAILLLIAGTWLSTSTSARSFDNVLQSQQRRHGLHGYPESLKMSSSRRRRRQSTVLQMSLPSTQKPDSLSRQKLSTRSASSLGTRHLSQMKNHLSGGATKTHSKNHGKQNRYVPDKSNLGQYHKEDDTEVAFQQAARLSRNGKGPGRSSTAKSTHAKASASSRKSGPAQSVSSTAQRQQRGTTDHDEQDEQRREAESHNRHQRWYSGSRAVKNNQVYWIWPTIFVFGVMGLFIVLFLVFVFYEIWRFFKRGIHLDGRSSFWGYLMYRASLILQEVQHSTLYLLVAFTFFVLTASILAQMLWPHADYELLENFKPPDLPEATWDAWKWVIAPDAGGAQRTPYGRFVGVLTCLGGLTVFALLISVISTEFAQWLTNIREGIGPVIEGGHILVLGWSENGNLLMQELSKSTEMKYGEAPTGVVVILAHNREHVLNQLGHVLPLKGLHITVRQGSPYRQKHLENVSAATARAIIVLGLQYSDQEIGDLRTCAVLRALKKKNWPHSGHVVALCMQSQSLSTMYTAAGPKTSILEPYTIGGQMVRKCIMTPAWPLFLHEVFGHGSQALAIAPWNGSRKPFGEIQNDFLEAIPIGVTASDGKPILCPSYHHKLNPGEGVLLVQASFDQAIGEGNHPDHAVRKLHPPVKVGEKLRLVIVGWNDIGPHVIKEMDSHLKGEISIISRSERVKRECQISDFGHSPKMKVTHYECNKLLKAHLEKANVASADVLIFLAEESCTTMEPRLIDEQTTGAVLAAMQVISTSQVAPPRVFVEVLDRDAELDLDSRSKSQVGGQGTAQLASRLMTVGLSAPSHPHGAPGLTTVNSAQLLYRITSLIIQERRLYPVLHELPDLVLEEISLPENHGGGSFIDAKSLLTADATSGCAIGWRMKGRWELNPKDKTKHYEWTKGDRLLVIQKEQVLAAFEERDE
eukprot:gnl/MRDRNA2_/MRDRNA2_27165_c0_seq1.p1 gnl/MRDRNA2_/MRDRNA2_27165_c0~~gnl/MRDRNA2_/MRDRNA2_27165_c0_seq1.p1  ORF type:complete len:928 (-),score=140.43 gnl/MRDRNA2_/MRDRNA2_27165_c0_seq1:27-2810(-)